MHTCHNPPVHRSPHHTPLHTPLHIHYSTSLCTLTHHALSHHRSACSTRDIQLLGKRAAVTTGHRHAASFYPRGAYPFRLFAPSSGGSHRCTRFTADRRTDGVHRAAGRDHATAPVVAPQLPTSHHGQLPPLPTPPPPPPQPPLPRPLRSLPPQLPTPPRTRPVRDQAAGQPSRCGRNIGGAWHRAHPAACRRCHRQEQAEGTRCGSPPSTTRLSARSVSAAHCPHAHLRRHQHQHVVLWCTGAQRSGQSHSPTAHVAAAHRRGRSLPCSGGYHAPATAARHGSYSGSSSSSSSSSGCRGASLLQDDRRSEVVLSLVNVDVVSHRTCLTARRARGWRGRQREQSGRGRKHAWKHSYRLYTAVRSLYACPR